ncbi:VOC family protein [Streptomyces sp. NPDC047042]|uniref:VOC family protein n=1 Tax=Streptomyces sp. NPDC047042 TaxID=3154807 RepID=UPI0034005DBB
MQPHFTGTCLITSDVPALAAFYAALLDATVEGGDPFAKVSVPGAVLSFFSVQGMESMVPGSVSGAASGGFTLEFEISDVDERHEGLLDRGVEIVKPPTTQPWGRRSIWLRDPDGNLVNLYQQT